MGGFKIKKMGLKKEVFLSFLLGFFFSQDLGEQLLFFCKNHSFLLDMSQEQRKSGRGGKTTWAQIQAMLEWLEVPNNFRLITGAAQKDVGSVTAGAKLKKVDGYRCS